MKKMTNEVRNKIKMYIKNKKDISEIIRGYSLKGENLSKAIIKDFGRRVNEDLSGVTLNFAVLGSNGVTTDCTNAIFYDKDKKLGSNFKYTRFLGKWILRGADLRCSHFGGAYIPYVEYQRADLRNAILCNTVFSIGDFKGKEAKISKEFFEQIAAIYTLDFDFEFKSKER